MMIEAVELVLTVMSDLAERRDGVTQSLEIAWKLGDVRFGSAMVDHGAVVHGRQAGEKAGSTWRARGRGNERMGEQDARLGQPLHVGRLHIRGAVRRGVKQAMIVRQEH